MTLSKNFINRSNYNLLVIKTDNKIEADTFQQLGIEYGIHWQGFDNSRLIKIDECHIYFLLNKKNFKWSNNLDSSFVSRYNWNKIIYNINNYNKIENFLKHGNFSPVYKPKKFNKSI